MGPPPGRQRAAHRLELDAGATAATLVAAGGAAVAAPVDTPWGDRNARVEAPDGMQLTLFTPGE